MIVLAASMFVGSGYKMERARADRHQVDDLLFAAGARPVYVQGALYPHAGYAVRHRVLHHTVTPEPDSAFLLCETCNPYPFEREDLTRRFEDLRRNPRYRETRAGGLSLFVPQSGSAPHHAVEDHQKRFLLLRFRFVDHGDGLADAEALMQFVR
jgi:hypothetical protein